MTTTAPAPAPTWLDRAINTAESEEALVAGIVSGIFPSAAPYVPVVEALLNDVFALIHAITGTHSAAPTPPTP